MMSLKNLSRFLFLVLAFAVFAIGAAAQEKVLRPVDEVGKDPSFKVFRDKLIVAVRKRDAKYVLSVVDPNIKNGFAGEDGIRKFQKQWKINSANSPLWDELLFVLTHGGGFSTEGRNKMFTAPYIYSNFPDDIDAFEYSVITDENVNLRATPFTTAPVVASLSYNIVKVDYQNSVKEKANPENYEWLKVETTGGKTGFVAKKFVKSSIDYRAGFEKRRGQWKMTFFLAGD